MAPRGARRDATREELARFSAFHFPGAQRGELGPFARRLALLIAVVLALQLAGTLAFALTEDVSAWRGFLWSIDTIATVGSIPSPETTGGQIVKVAVIMLGVGTLFYALVTVAEFFVAGHHTEILQQRRTLRRIAALSDHHIICGFGSVGRQVARDLATTGDRFVVVDRGEDNQRVAVDLGIDFLLGTPSDDEVLRAAGIGSARSVIACVDSDAENIFTCLTARELRSDVTIVARASEEDSEKKLLRAGANRVISPNKSSGAEMARLALQPQVAGVFQVDPEYRLEEIVVGKGCAAAGRTIGEVRGTALIAAVRDADGRMHPQPAGSTVLAPGDVVVAMGTRDALADLESRFGPAAGPVR
ncbi:MAG: potassium channel family protein [Solirubrobacterales bacterium]